MHILIIGGRQFLGRAIIDSALAKGHSVTIFNRGKTNPDFLPEHVNIIIGDRSTDLHLLDELQCDCVIDTCGYIPNIVEQSAVYFAGKVQSYCFVSTLSVYSNLSVSNDEAGVRAQCSPDEHTVTGENYGAMKALCEDIIMNHFSDTGPHMHFQIVTSSYSVVALTRTEIPSPSSSTVTEQTGSYDGSCFASHR